MKKILLLLIISLLPLSAEASNFQPMKLFNGSYLIQTPAVNMLPRAIAYMNYNDYTSALSKINRIIMICPDDPQAYFIKSQIDLALNNIENAIEDVNISIKNLQHPKLYIYRAYLYAKLGKKENLPQIINDIATVSSSNLSYEYRRRLLGGMFNNYIWDILDDKNISSSFKYSIYKYVMNFANEKYGNVYTVPVIASFIQYAYSLDDNDNLFKESGKSKEQMLQLFINAFSQGGKYSKIIKGALIVASGNIQNGSNIINEGLFVIYKNYGHTYGDTTMSTAAKIAATFDNLLKPKIINKSVYGLGIVLKTDYLYEMNAENRVEKILNSELTTNYDIKTGDYILAINGENVSRERLEKLSQKLIGEKDSYIEVTFGRLKNIKESLKYYITGQGKLYKTYTVVLPRKFEIPIKEYERYKLPQEYSSYIHWD